jgi:subtilisin family serine protease
MKKYVILRDLNDRPSGNNRRDATPEAFGPRTRTFEAATPNDLPAPAIETVSLTQREVEDAARDPHIKGHGEVMPTILLAPVALAGEAQVADATETRNWGIAAIGADASPFTGAGVRVAVLDTGIDSRHDAFRGMDLVCRDFTTGEAGGKPLNPPPVGWDADGHGTHCAGTIFGRDVGTARIGVARGVSQALIGKALDDEGRGTTEMLFQALQWAINEGVDVVSMSIGFDFPGLIEDRVAMRWNLRQAASDALVAYGNNLLLFGKLMEMVRTRSRFNEGTVIIAASGNESDRAREIRIATSVPAAADGVVSVGALGQKGDKLETAYFSNTAPLLCAPGVRILSAKTGGGLEPKSGTSMACPHVAGVAALWWEALRQRSPDGRSSAEEVLAMMRAKSRSRGVFAAFSKDDHGAGLVVAPTEADL